MPIISISLNEEILEEIDRIQKDLGFSGRSELIRTAVRMLISDSKEREKMAGEINLTLLLIHNQRAEDALTEIKHKFEDIAKIQIHSHLREDKCLEIFILEGDADRIKEMVGSLQTSKKMDYIKSIVV